jgi:hypothetical protein
LYNNTKSTILIELVRDKICELIPIPKLLDLLFNQSISDDITVFIGLRLVNNLTESG